MDDTGQPSGKLIGLRVVSLLTLVSRVVGLGRDTMMASLFGTGWILDAFSVAFRIPNMFRRLFGEGAMTAAFLPEFVRVDRLQGREAASVFFGGVAIRLFLILATCTALLEFVVAMVWCFAGLTERNELLCQLLMLMTPYLLLICMASLFTAALHSVEHFMMPALIPIVLNLVWLLGGLATIWVFAEDPVRVQGVAVCVVLGGVLQLALVQWKAAKFGIRIFHSAHHRREYSGPVRAVFGTMAPTLLGLSIAQVNSLIDSGLAWILVPAAGAEATGILSHLALPEGTASALYLGQRMFQFPLGIFGVALGTVLFPKFAKHAHAQDTHQLNHSIVYGLQLILLIGIPSSVGLWLMSTPITDLLFRYGRFGSDDAMLTSQMIASFGIGVVVYCGLLIVNRVFYAVGDQKTPMRQGLICVGLNIVFDFALLPVCGPTALPLASVAATSIQLILAFAVLRNRHMTSGVGVFVPILWRAVAGAVVMSGVVCAVPGLVSGWDPSSTGFVSRAAFVTATIFVAMCTYAATIRITGLSLRRLQEMSVSGPEEPNIT